MSISAVSGADAGNSPRLQSKKTPKISYDTHEFNKTNLSDFEQKAKSYVKAKNKAHGPNHVNFEQECLKKASTTSSIASEALENKSIISNLKGKVHNMKANLSPKFESFKQWYNTPIVETRTYEKIAGASQSGLDTVAGKSLDFVSKNAAKEGKLVKLGVKAAEIAAPAASKTSMFIGGMKETLAGSKLFTKGNFALAALTEAPDLVEAFKEGRGLNQAVQSTAKVGVSFAGGMAAMAALPLLMATPAG